MNELKQTNYTEKFFEQGDDDITVVNEIYEFGSYKIGVHMTDINYVQREDIVHIADLKTDEELLFTHIDPEFFEAEDASKEDLIMKIIKDYEAGKEKKIYYM